MSGPFASEETFEIVVKYANIVTKSGTKIAIALTTEELEKKYSDLAKEIHTFWVSPSWKQSNDILRQCIKINTEFGNREIDWVLLRSLHIENFMKAWDIKDEKGDPVPCNRKYIDMLSPSIASALADAFNDKTSIKEEDLGN